MARSGQPDEIRILSWLCFDSEGSALVSELCRRNFFPNSRVAISFLQRHSDRFRIEDTGNDYKVYAYTQAEICDDYNNNECYNDDGYCERFHLCKHFVTRSCKFGEDCDFNHQLYLHGNDEVLEIHQLDDLDDELILELLQLSCVECTVPDICKFYNNRGGCRDGKDCSFLHVCRFYIQGNCRFGNRCRRSHNIIGRQPLSVFQQFGININQDPDDLLKLVRFKKDSEDLDEDHYGDSYDEDDDEYSDGLDDPFDGLSSRSLSPLVPAESRINVPKQDESICNYHLSGNCRFGARCFNMHTDEVFQWCLLSDHAYDKWTLIDSRENLNIEKAYCDANNDSVVLETRGNQSQKFEVDFIKFTYHQLSNTRDASVQWYEDEPVPICRYAPSTMRPPNKTTCATTWLWFWKDDDGRFVEYGKKGVNGTEASISSSALEGSYKLGPRLVRNLGIGTSVHEIDFEAMKQFNMQTGKVRDLRRRPLFATKDSISHTDALSNSSCFPDTWDTDLSVRSTDDYQLCVVSTRSDEFRSVARRLLETMPIVSIVSIERVQNIELWEEFYRKRKKMEKKHGGMRVRENHLFHGTSKTVLHAICKQNFDHRLSGTRVGARLGQGVYFHKSAKYSDGFAGRDSKGRSVMFMARVLVGSYTKGRKDLRRPPPKDPINPLEDLYDTCVDNTSDPSIFVTFENSQVYPEYIITYMHAGAN